MVNGKKKGKNGELEVVRLCRAQGYEARRSAQYCGNNKEGTADVVGRLAFTSKSNGWNI